MYSTCCKEVLPIHLQLTDTRVLPHAYTLEQKESRHKTIPYDADVVNK